MPHPKSNALLAALLLISVLLFGQCGWAESPARNVELDVHLSTTASEFELFYDVGQGIDGIEHASVALVAGADTQHLVLPLPQGTVRALRIDPLAGAGTLVISDLRIVTPSTGTSQKLELSHVQPAYQIAKQTLLPVSGYLEITTVPDANDPQCSLTLDAPLPCGPQPVWLAGGAALRAIPEEIWWAWVGLLVVVGGWVAVGKWLVPRRQIWREKHPKVYRVVRFGVWGLGLLLAACAWAKGLNWGRVMLAPESESSWVGTMTHAIVHHWQFGREVILTYGPAMPLMLSSFAGRINTVIVVSEMLCKGWLCILMIWLGWRLSLGRRLLFWVAAFLLFPTVNPQFLWCFSMLTAGLLFARWRAGERWLLPPTAVYMAAVALIKVNFLIYALVALGAAASDQALRRRYWAAGGPILAFGVCFVGGWSLLGQNPLNLPVFVRGTLEMVSGFSQAMSLPPKQAAVCCGFLAAALSGVQLLCLFLPEARRLRWREIPLLAMLSAGLLLSWKASFVRADDHVMDFLCYAMVSAAAAVAFIPVGQGYRRWLDGACLLFVLLLGVAGIRQQSSRAMTDLYDMVTESPATAWWRVFHPRTIAEQARGQERSQRTLYALPRIKQAVGRESIDIFWDAQSLLLLNDLNFRPRPSFVSYSTYTPWLTNLDVAFYCSPKAPKFVLFALAAIDQRLPSSQNAPLLYLLLRYYEPVLTEQGYTLFRQRTVPDRTDVPGHFPLLREGEVQFGASLPLETSESVWCEVDLRETLAGKLRGLFYQEPALWIEVSQQGKLSRFRLVPRLAAEGFMLNPLLATSDDALRWAAGQPFDPVTSVRFVLAHPDESSYRPELHYRFRRVSLGSVPAAPPVAPPLPPVAPAPAEGNGTNADQPAGQR